MDPSLYWAANATWRDVWLLLLLLSSSSPSLYICSRLWCVSVAYRAYKTNGSFILPSRMTYHACMHEHAPRQCHVARLFDVTHGQLIESTHRDPDCERPQRCGAGTPPRIGRLDRGTSIGWLLVDASLAQRFWFCIVVARVGHEEIISASSCHEWDMKKS